MVQVIAEDHEPVLTDADNDAAAQVEGGVRYLIRIDYPEYDQQAAEQASSHENSRARAEEISKEGARGEGSRAGVRHGVPPRFAPELAGLERNPGGFAL
jgi:hypothetical protein